MKGRRKWAAILGVFLIASCVVVPVVYLVLIPMPLSVREQMEEDLSVRAPFIKRTNGPLDQGFLEQIISRNRKSYTYETVEVNQKYPTDGEDGFLTSDEVSKVLCISIRVTHSIPLRILPGGRSNPEIFNYLAQKENGKWSIEFLDKRSSTCG